MKSAYNFLLLKHTHKSNWATVEDFFHRERTLPCCRASTRPSVCVPVLSFVCRRYSGYCCPQGNKVSEWVWERHQEKVDGNDNLCLSSPSDRLITLKLVSRSRKAQSTELVHGDYIMSLYSHSETDLGRTINPWDL